MKTTIKIPEGKLSIQRAKNKPKIVRIYRGMVREMAQMILDDHDYPVIIDGVEGSGKSSLAINLASDLDPDILLNFENHITWDATDLKKRAFNMPPSALIHDEAGLDLFSHDTMSYFTKRIVKWLMVIRSYNHIPLLIIPSKEWLHAYLNHHRARLWLHVETTRSRSKKDKGKVKRGLCKVYLPRRSPFKKYTFWQFQYSFKFPDFPPEIRDQYFKLKLLKSHARFFTDTDQSRDLESILLKAYDLKDDKGKRVLTQDKLAKIFPFSQATISRKIKEAKT